MSIIVLHDFMLLLLCLLMVLMSCWQLLLRPLLLRGLTPLVLLIRLFLIVADPVLVGWRSIRLLGSQVPFLHRFPKSPTCQ